MTLTVRQILEPWRNARTAIVSFAASFLVVPLIAFAVTRLFPMEKPLLTGLILLSLAAGSEALPKITEMAKGNARYAVGLMGMQIVVSVICVPFLIAAFLPGVTLDRTKLVMKLIVLVLLPLAAGLFVNSRSESAAKRIERVLHKISTILLIIVFALYIAANFEIISSIFRWDTILVGGIYSAFAFVAGVLLGGPDRDMRMTLGVGSILRSGSIAMVFASQAFSDPKVITMIMLVVILWLPVLPAMVLIFRRVCRDTLLKDSFGSLSRG
jgi:BASS family bile acid:Na+ symporter